MHCIVSETRRNPCRREASSVCRPHEPSCLPDELVVRSSPLPLIKSTAERAEGIDAYPGADEALPWEKRLEPTPRCVPNADQVVISRRAEDDVEPVLLVGPGLWHRPQSRQIC